MVFFYSSNRLFDFATFNPSNISTNWFNVKTPRGFSVSLFLSEIVPFSTSFAPITAVKLYAFN